MKRILKIFALLAVVVSLVTVSASGVGAVVPQSWTYTSDADFDGGNMLNVNHDSPNNNQLQLNATTQPFPFIWIACSNRGTIVRVDVNTGVILGEYFTSPTGQSRDPSRTTVDLYGNVWSGNRAEAANIGGVQHGSVIKIGLVIGGTRCDQSGTPDVNGQYLKPPFDYSTAVDRNRDGLIKTSRGAGNILSWPTGTDGVGSTDGNTHVALVQDAEDECILIYQRTPNGGSVRHVSIDSNNDVWAGNFYNYNPQTFNKVDGDTGAILDSFSAFAIGAGGYGGLVDGNGVLWSASLNQGKLLRYDTNTSLGSTIITNMLSYGMGIDNNGYIWNSQWTNNAIYKISPAGVIVSGFPKSTGGNGSRGVVITPVDNNVWVANSYSNTVTRLDNNGNLLKSIPVGGHPTGVAVDSNGKVWVTNLDSSNAMRINPASGVDGLGAVDLTVNLNYLGQIASAGPYNYSDMTGAVAIGSTSPQGTWTKVQDSGSLGTSWGTIEWNNEAPGNVPPGASITVEARAADSQAGLPGETFIPVSDGVTFNLTGQYIEIRVTLKASSEGTSPVLSDLTLYETGAGGGNGGGPEVGGVVVISIQPINWSS